MTMLISFFEEFPTLSNLRKLKQVTWPTKLYLAAPSFKEFTIIKAKIKNKNIRQFIYWPILQKKEGYWISPFSERKALMRIFKELEGKNIPVMLDLELPTTQNPLLYLNQGLNFFRNKRLIKKFIQQYPGEVYCAEYHIYKKWLSWLGLHYSHPQIKIIKMLYHSMHHFQDYFLEKNLQEGKRHYGKERFIAGYGTIAKGITGREKILAPEELANDLRIAQQNGIKEVIIFRLGGLNTEYANVIKRYI
ncbi:hypothetical protein HYU22_04135 [Candidatus Woesearchaeota archaeon]|nr:hypothetical protein [Candidatus Woesearchaeota archaeon]